MTHPHQPSTPLRHLRTSAVAAAVLVFTTACQQLPQKVTVDFAEPRVAAAPGRTLAALLAVLATYELGRRMFGPGAGLLVLGRR